MTRRALVFAWQAPFTGCACGWTEACQHSHYHTLKRTVTLLYSSKRCQSTPVLRTATCGSTAGWHQVRRQDSFPVLTRQPDKTV